MEISGSSFSESNLEYIARHIDDYYVPVYRYIYSVIKTRDDVEDLTQAVFLAAIEKCEKYDRSQPLLGWLIGIAKNRIKRFQYTHPWRRYTHIEQYDWAVDDEDLIETQMLRKENMARVLKAVRKLKKDKQELLRLRYAVGLSYRQIGEIVDRSEKAVKQDMHRLHTKLRPLLGESK